ncbi:uncharacterized protein VTP21DRAFT_2213 [Calcarisporiella thermophila]|uniref:uncharacterized protein n=1 Tax=Calcarisporiella thermophila TaxID=911321 RepID=UPI003743C44E
MLVWPKLGKRHIRQVSFGWAATANKGFLLAGRDIIEEPLCPPPTLNLFDSRAVSSIENTVQNFNHFAASVQHWAIHGYLVPRLRH